MGRHIPIYFQSPLVNFLFDEFIENFFLKRHHLMKNLLKLVDNSNRILVLSKSFVNLFLLPNLSIFLRFLVSQPIFSLNHGASTKERWGDIVEQSVSQLLVASQTRKVCVINQSLILCCGSVRNYSVFVVFQTSERMLGST